MLCPPYPCSHKPAHNQTAWQHTYIQYANWTLYMFPRTSEINTQQCGPNISCNSNVSPKYHRGLTCFWGQTPPLPVVHALTNFSDQQHGRAVMLDTAGTVLQVSLLLCESSSPRGCFWVQSPRCDAYQHRSFLSSFCCALQMLLMMKAGA